MNRLYKKNELIFSLVWIAVYVVLFSLSDNLSILLGIEKMVTAPVSVLSVFFLWYWIKKQKLLEKYGLCSFKGDVKKYIYFIPLVLIVTCNLWNGVSLNLSPVETTLYILSMLGVGFMEEVIFRGFLFKALAEENLTRAILISSITFGLGHVINLFNGADVFLTVLQICYATSIGFLFTIIFHKGKSLFPCIIVHSLFNSLSVFSVEASLIFNTVTAIVLSAISIGYALYIIKNVEPAYEVQR